MTHTEGWEDRVVEKYTRRFYQRVPREPVEPVVEEVSLVLGSVVVREWVMCGC
jgi:hypothetical protein